MTQYETAEGFTVEVDPDSRTGWVSGRTGMTLAAIVTPNGASFLSDSGTAGTSSRPWWWTCWPTYRESLCRSLATCWRMP